MANDIEDMTTDELMKAHCEIQREFKHLGICQTKINHLCELERELTIREEAV